MLACTLLCSFLMSSSISVKRSSSSVLLGWYKFSEVSVFTIEVTL